MDKRPIAQRIFLKMILIFMVYEQLDVFWSVLSILIVSYYFKSFYYFLFSSVGFFGLFFLFDFFLSSF